MHRQADEQVQDEQVEIVELEPSYEAVPFGRDVVAAHLEEWGLGDLAPDASLVTSEMVSNAVIHARTPIELCLRRNGQRVRIEVSDGKEYGLAPSPPGGPAPRSLGLRVVAAISSRWGVDPLPDGKTVWAELGPGRRHRGPVAPVVAVGPAPLPLPDDWPEVRLVDVPVRLLREWEDHVRDLMREFALVSAGSLRAGGHREDAEVETAVTTLDRYWDIMRPIWAQARAVWEPAAGRVTFVARLPERVVVDGPRFLEAMETADELGRHGHLLTSPASPEVREFGRWFVHAMVRQVTDSADDLPEERCPFGS